MARIADKIKTINGSKETLKLAVRITELWFVGTPGRSKQAEMVIVDSDIRSVLTCRSQWSSQPSGFAQLSSRETFISKSEAKTISEINNLCEDGDLDLNASPKALDKLLGHLLAFKVKIQPQYKNSAVLKCLTDLTLINDVLDMLLDVEPFHECDDEARSSQISLAQLSSNKLAKHDQIE
ncbi:hypothetical protein JHK87_039819 [Glycine soja]|nr:hypothetical protein JHK87_039819 [Glycine soja]